MSLDSPLSLTRLLFRHALYRLKLELRVHRQVENCPLRSSFHEEKWTETSLIKKTFGYWQTISPQFKLYFFLKYIHDFQVKIQDVVSVITVSRSEPWRDFPEWTRGTSCQQHRHRVPLWSQDHIRHEAVHSMPAGFHSLSFRFFPLLPMDEKIIPLYHYAVTNTAFHNLVVTKIFITTNPHEFRATIKENMNDMVHLFLIFVTGSAHCVKKNCWGQIYSIHVNILYWII